jgi:hypothetical protein
VQSKADRLLGLRVRIPPKEGMDVCVVCSRGIRNMRTKDIKVHNGGGGGQTERKKKRHKKNPAEGMDACLLYLF